MRVPNLNEIIANTKKRTNKIYEQTYIDTCIIYNYIKRVSNYGITETVKNAIYKGKCRLCYNNVLYPVWQKKFGDNNNRMVIMLPLDVTVPPNSFVTVTHNEEIFEFQGAVAHKFGTHQLVVVRGDDRET